MDLQILVSKKGTKVVTATNLHQALQLLDHHYATNVRKWLQDVYEFADGVRKPAKMQDYAPRKQKNSALIDDYYLSLELAKLIALRSNSKVKARYAKWLLAQDDPGEQAEQFDKEQVMAVLDAHMKEVYWGYYRLAQGGMCLLGTEGIGAPEELPPLPCDQNGGTWVGAGDGWRLAQRFPEAISARVASVHTDCNPCARDLLLLALSDYQAGRQVSAASAEPAYLRDQSAWRKWRG